MSSIPSLPIVILKPGREKSLRRRHPWVFDGAIAQVQGKPGSGETVLVQAANGTALAVGSYSPTSQIRVRVWSFDPTVSIDTNFFQGQLKAAIAARQALLNDSTQTACRLVAAENDGLPGLIVDRYNDVLVCQFLTAGSEFWREALCQLLQEHFPECGLYERSDVDVRAKEGLAARTGGLSNPAPPDPLVIQEGPVQILVSVKTGHKTGFYLDQRENRSLMASLSQHKQVLNCFSYTGGFSLMALAGGASHVLNVEASDTAIALSEENHHLNGFSASQYDHQQGDVFQVLRQCRDRRQQFDLIVLDPPKFAESQSSLERAARGYKDINRLAFLLLRSGGWLMTFSCSGLLSSQLFQKIVADAALDAQRQAQFVRHLGQAADHPTLLSFPEGFYLKGLLCRVA